MTNDKTVTMSRDLESSEARHEDVKALHDIMQSVPCNSLYSLAEAVLDAGYAAPVVERQEPAEWRYRYTHRGELSKWFPVESYMKLYTIANDPAYEIQPLYTSPPAPVADDWPKLDKPAKVGAARFGVGVSTRLVIGCAQRLYEFEVTPEKEAARMAKGKDLLAQLRAPVAVVMSFEFEHPLSKERRTVTLTKRDVFDGMEDYFYDKLGEQICQCESVGETNVVDCNCDEYVHDFEIVDACLDKVKELNQ